MEKKRVIEFFGGVSKTAAALGVSKSAVSKWPDRVPWGRALQIERITGGQLRDEWAPPVAEAGGPSPDTDRHQPTSQPAEAA
ncbi:Cro/CI family transcriptional regulator [Methylolobus aquaticus]